MCRAIAIPVITTAHTTTVTGRRGLLQYAKARIICNNIFLFKKDIKCSYMHNVYVKEKYCKYVPVQRMYKRTYIPNSFPQYYTVNCT